MGLLDRFEDVADRLFGNPAEQSVASRIVTNQVVGAHKAAYRALGEPEPGADLYAPGRKQEIIESYHDRAVQSGLESQLTYYARGGASVRVRASGDTSIPFLADKASDEEIEEVLAREQAAAHWNVAIVAAKEGCSERVTSLIEQLEQAAEFEITPLPDTSKLFGGEVAFQIARPGISKARKIIGPMTCSGLQRRV